MHESLSSKMNKGKSKELQKKKYKTAWQIARKVHSVLYK